MWSVHGGCPDRVVGRREAYEPPACLLWYMLRGGCEVVVVSVYQRRVSVGFFV